MSEFKVGDRVKHVREGYGTVIEITPNNSVGVEFDEGKSRLHNCNGNSKEEHGWYCNEKDLIKIPRPKVGDRVKIRTDLKLENYDKISFVSDMRQYEGNIYTIDEVVYKDEVFEFYRLKGANYNWTAPMFEQDWQEEEQQEEKEEKRKVGKEKMSSLEEEIVDRVIPFFKKKVQKEIKDIVKGVTTVAIKINDEEIKEKTMQTHEQFKNVLTLVTNKIPAMLTGPAGSGKTGTCEKVAEVLGLDYYFSNAITQEYKLTGFIDANGTYQETQFYKAFKNGGLFVLDEIDASVPEALVVLNTAIANGYFDFPNGKIQAHKDFRIVACANTYGLGADDIYVGRYQLDGASLDRFVVVEFQYDKVLEKALVENQEWAEFVQELREKIKEKRLRHIVSMRATIYGDTLLKAEMNIENILKQVIFKNLKTDDIKTLGKLTGSKNKYINTYNTFIDNDCSLPDLPF